MKKKLILILCWILVLGSLYAQASKLDLLPDADGRDYQQRLKTFKFNRQDHKLDDILNFGKRNLQWLDHINKFRIEKLSFSSPENRKAYPIASPRIFNQEIVINQFSELLKELPNEMRVVLLGEQHFTAEPPIAINDYLSYGLLVDYIYQGAARWLLLSPYIDYYTENRVNDIRGFYYLVNLPNREEKLKNINILSSDEQSQITNWLIGLCYNTEKSEPTCDEKLNETIVSTGGDANPYYQFYVSHAGKIYKDNFIISDAALRNDIKWQKENQKQMAIIPFADTSDLVKAFLHNIELEWRWGDWQLLLQYTSDQNVPYIEFEPGVTPHVNDLGGNQIVMDANQPLSEWDSQWTIRHEFGHVLGFSDCYVEFYDDALKSFVSYQLDVRNLMCSRKGRLQEIHFLEMQRRYSS